MIVHEYLAKTAQSRLLAERADRVLPDGVSTDTRLFEPYGIYVTHALGARKWDADANEYRDFFGGHGALMLGHCHPRVTQAVQAAAGRGIQFAANNPLELEWAEQIHRYIPTAERVRFTGSGTEATLLAMRVARAFTNRTKLVRVRTHYHGWHDFAVSGYDDFFDGSAAPGVLPEIARNTLLITPNDTEDLRRVMVTHKDDIAALILEPLGSHFGTIPTQDSYLKEAVALARENGILVILDEIVSGFRVGPAGMQGLLDLDPDLTCMAKVAAGGLPGGIVCGSERVMSVLSRNGPVGGRPRKKVFHQGTFTGNPVTAAAALATIEEVVSKGLCQHATVLGELARTRLNELFAKLGTRWRAYGRFSAFHIFPNAADEINDDVDRVQWQQFASRPVSVLRHLRMALILEGVDIGTRGSGFVSGIHRGEDIDCLIEAFERALVRLRRDRIVE